MKVLVLTTEPITAQALRAALSADIDPSDADVMLVAPAFADQGELAARFGLPVDQAAV